MLGVKIMARINNFGVMAELIGASLLVILLIFHFTAGPAVVFHTLGLGAGPLAGATSAPSSSAGS